MNAPSSVIHLKSELDKTMLTRALVDAIESGRLNDVEGLAVYYQPFVRMYDARIIGAEALLRYNCHHGQISAGTFMPIIEKQGLVVPLTNMVLDRVAQDLANTIPEGLSVSVNIDATHFEHDIVSDIFSPLYRHSVDPSRLKIEITESAALENEIATPLLSEIREMGVSVLLDDFGTGYNSLLRLSECIYDGIKLDRLFVSRMIKNSRDRKIVLGITSLAEEIGVKVIAEGVENLPTLNMLKWMHVHTWQGYLCSPAIAANDLVKLVACPKKSDWASIICIE